MTKETTALPEFVFVFDLNNRVYEKDVNGRTFGGPIYREHWCKYEVIGEEKRSWLVNEYPGKITKAKAKFIADVDEDCWLNDNRYKIIEDIKRCTDSATLRAIAKLVGYEEKKM